MKIGPEELIQRSVKQYLDVAAPRLIWYSCPNGGVSKGQNGRNKAMGVRKGVPDLHFVLSGGKIAYIELKAPDGRLSPEQKAFQSVCALMEIPHAVCRSLDEVKATLRKWGVQLKERQTTLA
jgi:hypothetical protein